MMENQKPSEAPDTINTTVRLPVSIWERAKVAAIRRRITLLNLVAAAISKAVDQSDQEHASTRSGAKGGKENSP
jgi:acyl-homoserine lactone acylase PvdQ